MQNSNTHFKQCETANDLLQTNGRLKLSTPGTYYVSVRAVSLAGPGDWSEELLVTVGEDGKMALLWSILIPILVIGIFGTAIGFYLYYRRQRPAGDETTMNPIYWKRNFEGIEIPRDLIERGRELGTGSFGTVYAGIYNHATKGEMPCAIKEAKNSMLREQLLGEADLMRTIDTPHVVQLLGVVTEGFPQFVVLELMDNGDLKKHLRNLRRSPPNQNDILLMAIQVADGMAYLSTVPNPKIIHRDLAARNCMVNDKVIVKIGDFGLARDLCYAQDYYRMNGKDWLPVRWMSPESLRDSVFSSASDVWAYGVVLWEMVTLAEQPYQGLSNDEVLNFVKNRRTMEIPRNCPELIATLMQDCWAYEAEDRPTFVEICKRLQEYANDEFQRNSFITSSLCTRILRRMEMPSGDQDDLPIDEAERTPLQANGGSNGNGEARGQLDNGHAVIPVSEAINLRDFNGAGEGSNEGGLPSPRQHNMWERIRKILRNYRPAGQNLPTTAMTPSETGGSGDRSSKHHHQTATTVEA